MNKGWRRSQKTHNHNDIADNADQEDCLHQDLTVRSAATASLPLNFKLRFLPVEAIIFKLQYGQVYGKLPQIKDFDEDRIVTGLAPSFNSTS